MKNARCHPERGHVGYGLCAECRDASSRAWRPTYATGADLRELDDFVGALRGWLGLDPLP